VCVCAYSGIAEGPGGNGAATLGGIIQRAAKMNMLHEKIWFSALNKFQIIEPNVIFLSLYFMLGVAIEITCLGGQNA
jgi:hypothetical protein